MHNTIICFNFTRLFYLKIHPNAILEKFSATKKINNINYKNRSMKTKKLSFYALGAALMLTAASCSNDLPENNPDIYDGPVKTNYLSVNLISGGGQTTRADIYEGTDGTYQDGTGTENEVNNVRFYFFNEDGTAAKVKSSTGQMVSYLDLTTPPTSTTPDDNNIEKIVDAQLVINTAEGDKLPYSIVAVCNLPENLEDTDISQIENPESQTALNSIIGNYNVTKNGPFILSNTVYLNGSNQYEEQVPIADHIYSSPGAATADPVVIYVERVNAKAQTTIQETEQMVAVTDGVFADKTKYKNVYKTNVAIKDAFNYPTEDGEDPDYVLTDNDPIYVQFLGWNVTCTTNKSYLMKHINNSPQLWTNQALFGTGDVDWNSPTRHRSFWAINPALKYAPGVADTNYEYGDFYHAQTIEDFSAGTTDNPLVNYTYLQENAAESATATACAFPTQLIVAAKLLDKNGDPLTLAEYGFNEFTLNGLQKKYAGMCNVYLKETVNNADGAGNNGVKFVRIPWEWITFQTAYEAGQANLPNATEDKGGRYYVFAKLDTENPEAKAALDGEKIYVGNNPDAIAANETQINTSLIGLGHAKIWNGGLTYYYINIRHLGIYDSSMETNPSTAKPATWGIVRNHIYSMTINALQGLGTPVYNPEEVIYPEHPKEEDSYVGAEINIVNWRLVNQNVGFAW